MLNNNNNNHKNNEDATRMMGITIIEEPLPNDVLLGRGSRAREFHGTRRYNELVRDRALDYKRGATWEAKERVAIAIIHSIRATGGRFLRQQVTAKKEEEEKGEKKKKLRAGYDNNSDNDNDNNNNTVVWVEMDSDDLLKKTKQALRDTWRKESSSTTTWASSYGSSSKMEPTTVQSSAAVLQQPRYSSALTTPTPATTTYQPSVVVPAALPNQGTLQNLWGLLAMQSSPPLALLPSDFQQGLYGHRANMVSPAVVVSEQVNKHPPELLKSMTRPAETSQQKRPRDEDDLDFDCDEKQWTTTTTTTTSPTLEPPSPTSHRDKASTTPSSSSSSEQQNRENVTYYTAAEQDAAEQLLGLFTEGGELPQFTAEEERREKAQLTEEERQAALADMFGDMCSVTGHHQGRKKKRVKRPKAGSLQEALLLVRDMRREIQSIADKDKPALLRAMRDASPHEFQDERLALFLHCEKKDPRKAAERFVAYWEFRRIWFGENKFCLPLTLDGALRDDTAALEHGIVQLIPGLDASGRSILYFTCVDHSNETGSMLRSIWYIHEAAIELSKADGGVVIMYSAKSDDFWQIDMKLARAVTTMQTSKLPITICASHQVDLPLLVRRVFVPIWLAFVDKSLRNRHIVHDVPRNKLVESFGSYGITEDLVPEQLGGTCQVDHAAWLARRRALGK